MSAVIALRFAGWWMTTVATPSATSLSNCGSMRRMVSAPAGRPVQGLAGPGEAPEPSTEQSPKPVQPEEGAKAARDAQEQSHN